MTVAVCYPEDYPVEETFQLLKIPWVRYEAGGRYDVVIARRADVDGFSGPVIDLTGDDIFQKIRTALNTGGPHVREPVLEQELDRLRSRLRGHTRLVEIPPVPWDHSFMVALTHDVDLLSVRERRWLSAGYAAFQCLCRGRIGDSLRMICAKAGLCQDPYLLFPRWMALEKELGVRSTFFFLPFRDRAGSFSPQIRAGHYTLSSAPVMELIGGGWEAGVHGIDNWTSEKSAAEELAAFREYWSGDIGNRVHWLIYDDNTFPVLDRAGYMYDSTVGYNDDIGFRAGTLQCYRPEGCTRLVELPLHIQDIALFGRSCRELSGGQWTTIPCLCLDDDRACGRVDALMDYAKLYGGVITVLWHYESLAPPSCREHLYRGLVQKAVSAGAWAAPAGTIVQWFLARRSMRISCTEEGNCLCISVEGGTPAKDLPGFRLRVYIPPDQIQSVDSPYIAGMDHIDINVTRSPVRVLLS